MERTDPSRRCSPAPSRSSAGPLQRAPAAVPAAAAVVTAAVAAAAHPLPPHRPEVEAVALSVHSPSGGGPQPALAPRPTNSATLPLAPPGPPGRAATAPSPRAALPRHREGRGTRGRPRRRSTRRAAFLPRPSYLPQRKAPRRRLERGRNPRLDRLAGCRPGGSAAEGLRRSSARLSTDLVGPENLHLCKQG